MKLTLLILIAALSLSASEWSTNIVLIETNSVTGSVRFLRPLTVSEIAALLSRELPPAPPTNVPAAPMLLTNSAIAHPERKRKVMAYRKECPECGVTLTTTNVTSWLVTEETNSFKTVSVVFQCLGCDETYVETIRKPIRKTKVEEIVVETVK